MPNEYNIKNLAKIIEDALHGGENQKSIDYMQNALKPLPYNGITEQELLELKDIKKYELNGLNYPPNIIVRMYRSFKSCFKQNKKKIQKPYNSEVFNIL